MMDKKDSIYKNISEVAQILKLFNTKNGKLSTHTLRYWEKEFKQIRPKILAGKRRYYDEKTINILKKIKYLLKVKGMTINGAKKHLNHTESIIDEPMDSSITANNLKNKVKKISNILKEIKHGKKNSY
tara:strand:+ start:178 stop:561 length:384 start_codon:yes stop_codon:yes gene_type:complete